MYFSVYKNIVFHFRQIAMTETYLTFQKFNDIELANEIAERLKQNDIECFVQDNQGKFFDPSFANNSVEADIAIKLKPDDFIKANKALEDYYKKHLDTVDKDYYLFEFSDTELIDIISKPDEWGKFDYQLAQKILKDKGREIKPDTVQKLKTQRIDELLSPEKANRFLIIAGYFFIFVGAVIGIIIGWSLYNSKKTLPNGQRVFVYRHEDRMHGSRILLMATIVLIVAIIIRLILLFRGDHF